MILVVIAMERRKKGWKEEGVEGGRKPGEQRNEGTDEGGRLVVIVLYLPSRRRWRRREGGLRCHWCFSSTPSVSLLEGRKEKEGRREREKEGRKEKERRKEGREGRKEGRKEKVGRNEGTKERRCQGQGHQGRDIKDTKDGRKEEDQRLQEGYQGRKDNKEERKE